MWGLLLGVILATGLVSLSYYIPQPWNNNFVKSMVRSAGVVIMIFSVASTSYVHVPDGFVGQVFRVYAGGPLTNGRIVAVDGENGPQADILRPGFHLEAFVNIVNSIDTSRPEIAIADGKVGVLTARDGAAFRPGQAFADPFPDKFGNGMLDARTFIKNGGQRGPQLWVLTPGRYPLNGYLWEVVQKDAYEVQAGFVGVVKSNVHADIDFGTLKAKGPENCDTIKKGVDEGRIDAPLVPLGCVGVWSQSLPPGKYYLNPAAFSIKEVDTRAQVLYYAGGYKRSTIALTVDAKGEIVQTRTDIDIPVDTANADQAIFVKMEGWDVPLELRVIAQISPDQASCVVAGIGSFKDVEDRVLTPSIRAITRDVAGGTYEITEAKVDEAGKPILDKNGNPIIVTTNRLTKVLDLINQRPLIEKEIERRIRPEAEKSCVTIREVRLGEPAIPPELLVAVRRQQLATQLQQAFVQEQLAQEKRIASEKAKATANQQNDLVTAEIGVQKSLQNAQAARNEGQGQRDKLTLIAEGQKSQAEVLGIGGTIDLRKFELLIDFYKGSPQVLTTALANAQKFVPNVQVGSGDSGANSMLGMLMAVFGQSLTGTTGVPIPTSK